MSTPARAIPVCLSIAGSDSGGGAGIQADLKAFAACGVHGTTAITAITAQNTTAVTGVWPLPTAAILAQVHAVVEDMDVRAVKIGMLGSAEITAAVAEALALLDPAVPVVVDPVMVAESGARLLPEDAHAALIELILPRATVVTPNLPEARVLAGAAARAPADADEESAEAEALARAVHRLGPACVVVTGGHRAAAVDTVFDGAAVTRLPGERHPDGAAHGSGCTHASALAAHLALGYPVVEAARRAKAVAAAAVRDGLRNVGHGAGPVDALGVARRGPGDGTLLAREAVGGT
ncbi:bifunctional hydroxymethylpyrimidine kinase/phosphomethylpyrimidine kinase [Paraconexibacter sp. AEG42_29]|uniref:bifunctional hydroxymethylpyrimidine kinase/phosphomethylpyrimidine kinase n=1 Tax=Paraconexibacter sp. AEG42_29 TaxID=2997339 RepID=UPI00339D34E1